MFKRGYAKRFKRIPMMFNNLSVKADLHKPQCFNNGNNRLKAEFGKYLTPIALFVKNLDAFFVWRKKIFDLNPSEREW